VPADGVNWARASVPQDDGYDTEVVLAHARREQGWRRPEAIEAPSFCDGRVGLRLWSFGEVPNPSLTPGPVEHPNLVTAEDHVRTLWPAAYEQFTRIVSDVYPMTLHPVPGNGGASVGSCSGQTSHRAFSMYVTYFDPFGTAESMVHEMAHIKLRCLGIQVESRSRFILNSPAERFVSPLRSYTRPMTALLHAFYSWLHLTELGLRLMPRDPVRARARLDRNCRWIEQMLQEIRTHVRLDEAGAAFVLPLYAWAEQLLARGRAAHPAERCPSN
jgi:HEXXH motif-containing protein